MKILSHTEYLCRYINSIDEIDGRWFKVKIGNQTKERMCVTFLEPYRYWWIGDFKWWFKNEFFSVYELKNIN